VVTVLLLVVDRPPMWSTAFQVVPFWLLVLTCGLISVIPWPRWHFSLRTLLIATTLVAAGLGLLVWAAGK
jgi:hypothetical protein